jgi:hypothetical protein
MTKAVWTGVATAAAVLFISNTAFAQAASDSKSLNISAVVNAKAKLTLSGSVSFPDDDPDTSNPLVSTTDVTVSVKARTTASGNVLLTVLANQDLTSGTDVIAINNLTWAASGLNAGTMDKAPATAFTLGSWTGSGTQSGTQTYKLVNLWTYVPGTYQTTINYTLSAP